MSLERPLLPGGGILPGFALLVGWLAIAPGLAVAFLLGNGRSGHATLITGLGFMLPLACLLWCPSDSALANLLAGQAAFGLTVLLGLTLFLRGQAPVSRQDIHTLLRFVPAGLAIGILSPASIAWARLQIADNLSWHAAGQVQALWRTSEWITAITAGLLNAHFLPRLSAASERSAFIAEWRRALLVTLLPAAVLLAALWLFLPAAMAVLYPANIQVSQRDALFFFLGDWARIFSWVSLIGLFARRSAWEITAGEFLSLPLFALLLTLYAGHFGLQDVGLAWFATYLAYAGFNAAALWRATRVFRYESHSVHGPGHAS